MGRFSRTNNENAPTSPGKVTPSLPIGLLEGNPSEITCLWIHLQAPVIFCHRECSPEEDQRACQRSGSSKEVCSPNEVHGMHLMCVQRNDTESELRSWLYMREQMLFTEIFWVSMNIKVFHAWSIWGCSVLRAVCEPPKVRAGLTESPGNCKAVVLRKKLMCSWSQSCRYSNYNVLHKENK